MLLCANCGSELNEEHKFCANCGTAVQSITVASERAPKATHEEPLKSMTQTPLYKKLEYYRNKVLKIDMRNRSILLRSIRDKWCFDLAGMRSAGKIVENAITDRKPVCIIADSERSESNERYRTGLRNLYRNVTQIQRETGRQEFYLGFPFLVGHINEELYVRGPLVLLPVSIAYMEESKPRGWYIRFSEDKDPILNRALFEALKTSERGLRLPESFTDDLENLLNRLQESRVREGCDIESIFLDGLVTLLRETSIPIDYSYELNRIAILNKIDVSRGRIKMVSIDDRRSWIENEPLRLVNHKIIGVFPQGENAIYSEYEELIKKAKYNGGEELGPIKELLQEYDVSTANDEEMSTTMDTEHDKEYESIKLDDIPTEKLNLVVPSDASQDTVVLAAQSSNFIVVRGPPGTGKSQVIVNLISNALSKRQKILLVCEKEQALSVVYQRLEKLGLSRFIAFLSDPQNRSVLYNKLGRILESEAISENLNITNQKFNYYSHEIDRIIENQNKIINALKEQDTFGISISKLYMLAKPDYIPKLNLSWIGSELKYHALTRTLDNIQELEYSCKKFDSLQSPWIHRKEFSNFGYSDKFNIQKIIDNIVDLSKQKNALFLTSSDHQKTLINALETLSKESGGRTGKFFHKFLGGGKEHAARDACKRLLKQPYDLSDIDIINDLFQRTNKGLQIWDAFDGLSQFLHSDGIDKLAHELYEDRYDSLQSKLLEMRQALNEFDELQHYDKKKSELSTRESEILMLCIQNLSNENGWYEILKQEFYSYWITHLENKYSNLKGQPFEVYIQNRDQLSKLIKEHQKIVVKKIMTEIDSMITRPGATTLKPNYSYKVRYDQWNSLLDELNKKRHILPIRKLIEKYESIILRTAPCWLATPSVVSTIFPLKRNLFDYVIVDEASQATVEESLPSLQRGKNIVVIGDEKQLPPVDRFRIKVDSNEDEDEEQEDIDRTLASDSILSLANRTFSHSYLTWHYRSTYQELIDFSNHTFYNQRLKIAPNIQRNAIPIKWISCNNGEWIRGRNTPEAVRVVKELKNILVKNKNDGINRSIGIITFNLPQKEEIEEEIFRRTQIDREFKDLYYAADNEKNLKSELPFVRNVERVQGEERDIIIFSLGYAEELMSPEDTITIQFGSLNQRNGEKYLNVAITRARHEVIIICSFDPFRIDAEDAEYEGPKRLKEYLCYAKSLCERGLESKNILSSSSETAWLSTSSPTDLDIRVNYDEEESDFSESILQKSVQNELERMGYTVDLNVGHSKYKIDMAVVHPDLPSRYILGIECDGKSFLFAPSTKERDITRQEFLESKGWAFERIWSRNWWRDSRKEVDRIHHKIQELRRSKMLDEFVAGDQIIQQHLPESNRLYEELIKNGESDSLEFKGSLVWDYVSGSANKSLWYPILKTVAAFMNSEGGILMVGIADNGDVLGIENDFNCLGKKKSWDEWDQHFVNIFNEHIGKEFMSFVRIKCIYYNEKPIAIIQVKKNNAGPTYLDPKSKAEFHIRSGTTTQLLNPKETVAYAKQHWGI